MKKNSIPFCSVDFTFFEFLQIILDFLIPINKKRLKIEYHDKIKNIFNGKNISLLPSGRLGFYLSLKYYFKKGDEIILSSMSFPLYAKIANQLGLKIKIVDIEADTFNIDVSKIENLISDKTKGIVVTHLFGYPAKMDKIIDLKKKFNLILIEDCAQSFNSSINGKKTGCFGEVGIFSTSLLKVPTTLGGGFIVTENSELVKFINKWTDKNLKFSLSKYISLFIKNIIALINSIPFLYNVLSSKIFSFLEKYNPRIYRSIIYSGMGVKDKIYDPRERNQLEKYQLRFGLRQLKRINAMQNKNILYLTRYKDSINLDLIKIFFPKDNEIYWNGQYGILIIPKEKYKNFYNHLFYSGIHSMMENVWDISEYNYEIENKNEDIKITKNMNSRILRIQNSSLLKDKNIDFIVSKIKDFTV